MTNLDSGKIITKKKFFFKDSESEQTLKIKTQKLEYLAYPEAIFYI